jgi:hypothetical protein
MAIDVEPTHSGDGYEEVQVFPTFFGLDQTMTSQHHRIFILLHDIDLDCLGLDCLGLTASALTVWTLTVLTLTDTTACLNSDASPYMSMTACLT